MGHASAFAPQAPIYLDHAAATPLAPDVVRAMDEVRETGFANPSSPHVAGRRAKALLEDARERIVALAGGDLGPGTRLVFTSGATESNRLGVLGLATAPNGRILSSARDHSSLVAAARDLTARGWEAVRVPLDAAGAMRLEDHGAGRKPQEILCVTLACGQSGAWEDVAGVAAWAAAGPHRAVHVDATQALLADMAGPFGLPPRSVATLAFAPHKFGGPRGIGGLFVRRDVHLEAVVPGPQEAGLRGGTETVALAVGFARALELAVSDRVATARRLATLRDRLESSAVEAARAAGIEACVVAAAGRRAPHVATITFPGIDRQALVMAADLEGVCCATGTACASGSSEPAPALLALGLRDEAVRGAVRFSLGRDTSAAEVDEAVRRIALVCGRMATRSGR